MTQGKITKAKMIGMFKNRKKIHAKKHIRDRIIQRIENEFDDEKLEGKAK